MKDDELTPDGWMKPGGETERALQLVSRRGRPGLEDADFGFPSADAFDLWGEVGKGHESRGSDVMMAKRAMAALGYYPKRLLLDPTDIVDRELHNGITKFQIDNKLYSDGWMGPGGETAGAVRNALGKREERLRPFDPLLDVSTVELRSDAGGEREEERAPEVDLRVPENARVSTGTDGSEDRPQRPKEEQGSERPHTRDVLRPTQEPVDADEMYRQLGFDPKGKGQYDEAFRDPIRAAKAKMLEMESTELVKKEIEAGKFPPGAPHNNEADAFRHAYWSYRVTQEMGAAAAKRFGDGHEITRPGKHGERLMDLFNNKVGRELALDPANKGRPAAEVIREALANGQLKVTPFRMLQPEIDRDRPPRY